jgi:hypothetical protein
MESAFLAVTDLLLPGIVIQNKMLPQPKFVLILKRELIEVRPSRS